MATLLILEPILHSELPACVRVRVVDRSVLKLNRMRLEAPVVERSEGQGGGGKCRPYRPANEGSGRSKDGT